MKLALIFVGVFSTAIFGLLFYVYWSMLSYLHHATDRALGVERGLLSAAFEDGGREAVAGFIAHRLADRQFAGWYYLLADPGFRPIAGNLERWPAPHGSAADWSRFANLDAQLPAGKGGALRASYRVLPDGGHLFVGRQTGESEGLAARTTTWLAWAALLFFILAAAAGISTSRRSVARIEAVNATSREIMHSGLGKRMPMRGTGDEWDELAANLNSMLERIEELVETNRQVSDNVAHDLRTPLTRMRGRLERGASKPLDAPGYQALVGAAIADLDDILRIFSSLLRISRVELRDREEGFRDLDLRRIAGEVVELFDAAAEESGVRLVLAAEGAVPVIGDRDLLFDAISNLLDNAIKHGGRGGEIRIAVRRGEAGPQLSVSDHGPGIPPAERQNVLKRFYRLEQSRHSPGNGLGLSLVAAVAYLHGARIDMADNAPGLRIELSFPPPERRTAGERKLSSPSPLLLSQHVTDPAKPA